MEEAATLVRGKPGTRSTACGGQAVDPGFTHGGRQLCSPQHRSAARPFPNRKRN
jgi:hypothetical protein